MRELKWAGIWIADPLDADVADLRTRLNRDSLERDWDIGSLPHASALRHIVRREPFDADFTAERTAAIRNRSIPCSSRLTSAGSVSRSWPLCSLLSHRTARLEVRFPFPKFGLAELASCSGD